MGSRRSPVSSRRSLGPPVSPFRSPVRSHRSPIWSYRSPVGALSQPGAVPAGPRRYPPPVIGSTPLPGGSLRRHPRRSPVGSLHSSVRSLHFSVPTEPPSFSGPTPPSPSVDPASSNVVSPSLLGVILSRSIPGRFPAVLRSKSPPLPGGCPQRSGECLFTAVCSGASRWVPG